MGFTWKKVEKQIRSQLPTEGFTLWRNPTTFLEKKDRTLILTSPNKFSRKCVMEDLEFIQEKLDKAGWRLGNRPSVDP